MEINGQNVKLDTWYKRVFNYCQTSVLFLYKGDTLVDKRAQPGGWYSTP